MSVNVPLTHSAVAAGDHAREVTSAEVRGRPRRSLAVLALILASFAFVRVPIMYRQPGGLDEEYYAVPGLTILTDGIPRMPHAPQRDPSRPYFLADQAFFAEPPLSYYWQAAFYAVLPDVYGTARLSVGVAALVSLWLVYELGRSLYRDDRAALWGAGLYSLSRTFYFTGIAARPDMLCTAFGLGALLGTARWHATQSPKWLVVVGLLLGLGGLTHPVALVYALQCATWVFLASSGWKRLTRPLLLAALALGVFSLWLPLILIHPEAFRAQFFNNILRPAGPGLLTRLAFPWPYLAHHLWMVWYQLETNQFTVIFGGAAIALLLDARRRERGPLIAAGLAWSSVILLSTTAGIHPTWYHWCFPTALLSLCTGRAVAAVADWCRGMSGRRLAVTWSVGLLLVIVMLKGAGLRTWWAHLRHWGDPNYSAPAFAQRLLSELPPDARYTVDREFVVDFVAAGRRTLVADISETFFRAQDHPYDYLVISRHGLNEKIPTEMNAELIRTYGNRDDLFSCYAEIYRPARSARSD